MSARTARFRVVGRLDMAAKIVEGTVSISRGAGLFEIRRLRARHVYTLPLSDVATMVVQRIQRAEVFQKRLERAAKKKAARR
jgi:hypothetical protein